MSLGPYIADDKNLAAIFVATCPAIPYIADDKIGLTPRILTYGIRDRHGRLTLWICLHRPYFADIAPYIADDIPYISDDKPYIADDIPYISDRAI